MLLTQKRMLRRIVNKNIYRTFSTNTFKTNTIKLHDQTETVVEGGHQLFPILKYGFKNIKQIGVIGWGSQAPAQAQNLRSSLANTDINVCVGLRENSNSFKDAEKHHFSKDNGTLGEMYQVVSESDLVLYLISDYGQVKTYQDVFKHMKPGSTLGLSHGFLLGYFDQHKDNLDFPEDINVVMVAPKGMGPTVRDTYLEKGGINSSVAVHQDINGLATDHALSWAIGIGSPYIFNTDLRSEYISDIFGERGILLGGIYGISEFLFRKYCDSGINKKKSYQCSAYNITGTINNYISKNGLLKVYTDMNTEHRMMFEKYYNDTYPLAKEILQEIYDEVKSGNEIRSVIMAGERLEKYPMGNIDTTDIWNTERNSRNYLIDENVSAITSPIYIATMMAQIDILIENGHNYSEIANESIIEAIDSLNPYLYQKGISHMIDNCSTTARLGARKWGPRFDYLYSQNLLNKKKNDTSNYIENFKNHPIHGVLESCNQYRPKHLA